MRAAVVGAAGFIGQSLQAFLREKGDEVIGYDLPISGNGFAWRPLDVSRDTIALPSGTDAVFYLAQSPSYHSFPQEAGQLWAVNVLGAVRAAEAAVSVGARVFFYASTGNVYAPSFEPLSEDHPVRRDDPYALSKLQAEEALRLFGGLLAITCTRFFGVYGPGQRKMLPAVLAQKVRDGQPVSLAPMPGESEDTGGLRVSFLYIADAIRCLRSAALAALGGRKLPFVLNVAGPEAISLRTFSEEIGRCLGRTPSFAVQPDPRKFDLIADITRLKALEIPGFTPFSRAMDQTLLGGRG